MLLFGGSDGGTTAGGGEAVDAQLWRLSLTPAEAPTRPSPAPGSQVAPLAQLTSKLRVGSRGESERNFSRRSSESDRDEAEAEAEAAATAAAEARAEAVAEAEAAMAMVAAASAAAATAAAVAKTRAASPSLRRPSLLDEHGSAIPHASATHGGGRLPAAPGSASPGSAARDRPPRPPSVLPRPSPAAVPLRGRGNMVLAEGRGAPSDEGGETASTSDAEQPALAEQQPLVVVEGMFLAEGVARRAVARASSAGSPPRGGLADPPGARARAEARAEMEAKKLAGARAARGGGLPPHRRGGQGGGGADQGAGQGLRRGADQGAGRGARAPRPRLQPRAPGLQPHASKLQL